MKKETTKTGAAGAVPVVSEKVRDGARAAFAAWVAAGCGSAAVDGMGGAASFADVRGDVERVAGGGYELAARAFLVATGARFSARYLGAFDSVQEWGENETGAARCGARGFVPVWRVRIATAAGSMSVRFRGSLNDGALGVTACGVYSVLACLTKYAPGPFDDFASEFGYFPLSSAAAFLHARRVWRGCLREFAGVCRVWPAAADREGLENIN